MARQATPQDFYSAALQILAESGRNGLRIGLLCRAVGVTSGSFYHHFGSWEGFVAALLDHWQAEQVARIIGMVGEEFDPVARIRLLKHLAITLPHDAEAAIRRWAGTDATVAAAQRAVDAARRHTLDDVLRPAIDDAALRALLTEMGLDLLVGHQQLLSEGAGRTDADLAAVLDQFELLVRVHAAGGLETAVAASAAPAGRPR